MNAKTPNEITNKTTAPSDNRRPVNPRHRFTPSNTAYPSQTPVAAMKCPAADADLGIMNPAKIPNVNNTPPNHNNRSNETNNSLTGGKFRNNPLFKCCSFNCRSNTRNITPATAANANAPYAKTDVAACVSPHGSVPTTLAGFSDNIPGINAAA
jgi:hypothetical protein